MASLNEELRKRAAREHVQWARQEASESARDLDGVGDAELAILLGRVVRALEELNGRFDFLEQVVRKKL